MVHSSQLALSFTGSGIDLPLFTSSVHTELFRAHGLRRIGKMLRLDDELFPLCFRLKNECEAVDEKSTVLPRASLASSNLRRVQNSYNQPLAH
jgi:hypothetical protein